MDDDASKDSAARMAARNRRTALLLGAVALAFYIGIMVIMALRS